MGNLLLAWAATFVLIAAAYPTSAALAHTLTADRDTFCPSRSLLVAVLTLAISAGGLSLMLLWEGLLEIRLTFAAVALPYLIAMIPGAFWWRHIRRTRDLEGAPMGTSVSLRPPLDQFLPMLIIGGVTAAVLFNAVYYPLYRDDTLGIYRPAALPMFNDGRLDPLTGADSLYKAYPVLIPSLYALGYMASGWENDYLAKLLPTLLSLGCLPAAYLLGGTITRRQAGGWIAAVLLAITPAFGRWGSSAYVDLPMAFFYTLCAYFALRGWDTRKSLDLLLAGIMLGLAANAKNAALLGVPLLGAWFAYGWIVGRFRWKQIAVGLAAAAGIGAPFYVRNLIGAGFLIPATAWTDQAQRTLETLFAFITRPENFGITGALGLIGWGFALTRVRNRAGRPRALAVLGFSVPFFAAWWVFVSYDPRFLLLFLPILCAGAAWPLIELDARLPSQMRLHARRTGLVIALALGLITTFYAVEYKQALVRNPFMSHEEKLALVGRTPPSP